MPFDFKFTDVGEGIAEGEIVKWLIKPGDLVKEDQTIVQIETDKAVVDIPSPKSGKVLKIHFKEGEVIKVGQTLVTIGEAQDVIIQRQTRQPDQPQKSTSVVGQLEEAPEESTLKVPHAEPMRGITPLQKVLISPSLRKQAKDQGINLTNIKGSGPQGTITKSDLGITTTPPPKQEIPQQKITIQRKYDQYGYVEHMPLKGIRKTIARNMVKSITEAAQVTAMEDINVTKLAKIREQENKTLEKQNTKLTFLPFITKAVIAALKENPILNSSLVDEDIIIKKYYNIGIAVETELGLMVPVIKRAEDKSILQITQEITNLAEQCRTRKIDIMDLQGSTFTLTNYGSIGGNYGTPIINPGEAAILGLGRITEQPIVEQGKIKIAKILPVSLTFDHRILDGAQAARFLESLKMYLEDPDHLLLELK